MFKFFEVLRNTKTIIPVLVIFAVSIVVLSIIFIPRNIQPTQNTLSDTEKQYRNNLPQVFPSGPGGFGTLVVNSNPSEARVIIDGAEDEGGNTSPTVLPINQTSFKVSTIPEGKHTLFVSKKGYEFQELSFEIKTNQITRLDLQLSPMATLPLASTVPLDEWKKKLPITTPEYVLEYDNQKNVVKATLKISDSNAEGLQQKAQLLYGQLNDKLRELGADVDQVKIEFKIE